VASEGKVQCPCGRTIEKPEEYKLLFLKMEMHEIDILCPNDSCYLREIGYIKFDLKDDKPVFKEATFYPPFVTWNMSQLGEKTSGLLRTQLREIVTRIVDWKKIAGDMTRKWDTT